MKNRSSNIHGPIFALISMLKKNGKITKWLNLYKYLFRSVIMTPFYYSEKLFRSKRINHTEISSPPIFIIGHYRSGTTFIHKLLSCDQRWAKIKTFDFLFPYYPSWLGRIMKPVFQFIINTIKLKNPHFNNYLLDLDDPMEEDMVTIGTFSPYSAFWGELFPKNFKKILSRELTLSSQDDKKNWQETYLYLLKKITLKNDEKRLLLKNPPNTGRVQHLLELFPDAKFVFIYRNPYRVYYSTLNLWKNLLEKMYALQKITDQERDENIFFHYKFVMEKYLKEKVHIPPGNLIEIKYENLKKNPFLEIQSIYEQLNLGEFDNVKPVLDKLLSKEKKYSTYHYNYDDETQKKIYKEWGHLIDLWNYQKLTND